MFAPPDPLRPLPFELPYLGRITTGMPPARAAIAC
jgi:hypothetical protein